MFVQQFNFLGIPSEIYTYGTQFVLIIFGIGFCVFVSAELWIPILYDLRVVSIYEYFFLRFGSKFPRRLMSVIFVLKVLLTNRNLFKLVFHQKWKKWFSVLIIFLEVLSFLHVRFKVSDLKCLTVKQLNSFKQFHTLVEWR